MDKGDVYMDITQKHPQGSTYITPFAQEELPFVATAASVMNIHNENGTREQTNYRSNSDDDLDVQSEMKEQINSTADVQQAINAKGDVSDQINVESKTVDQADVTNLEEKPINAMYEMDEQNITGGQGQAENPVENDTKGRNFVENLMDEKTEENVLEEKFSNENVSEDGGEDTNNVVDEAAHPTRNGNVGNGLVGNKQLPTGLFENEAFQSESFVPDEDPQSEDEEMIDAINNANDGTARNEINEGATEVAPLGATMDDNTKSGETVSDHEIGNASLPNHHETAMASSVFKYSTPKAGDSGGKTFKAFFSQAKMAEGDEGTPEDQAAFIRELEAFHRENATDFRPPKFYGKPLNCLKLWRAVIRLGGYDRVTAAKLWRQVGESFHPPKTCTTVSWTFRIFYEKALLEYERHKRKSGEIDFPVATPPEASVIDNDGNGCEGSGSALVRARRDVAALAMQGWRGQSHYDCADDGEPIVKDKYPNSMAKREKIVKSIGSLKQKRPNEVEHPVKAARVESFKQIFTSVVDVGPPADWVKVNIRQTRDCFEVYALVPGLSREEVRVQSDPAGRLVITGEPEQPENPWGTTPFKKVVTLPGRIDPHTSSAVVSIHGRLFVRVPFEQPNA